MKESCVTMRIVAERFWFNSSSISKSIWEEREKEFFEEIMEVVSVLGGETNDRG